ncbi:MAG TPA: acetate--CoA ligase family protein [Solirubrobacteraceae bacterium]
MLNHSPVGVARAGIDSLLFPRSAVIVGATPRNPELIAGVLRFPGPVWGVHPVRRDVLGLQCRPSVSELPEVPDVAVLLVGHQRVQEAFEDAAEAGVRAFIVPGLGSEAGADGRVIAASLAARAHELGAAVLGPNCMGAATPHSGSFWLGTVPDTFLPGTVSVIAQSGSLGEALVAMGGRVGFRVVVSSGAEAVRDAADFLAFLAGDEETTAIGLFLETVRRPAAFAAALDGCAAAGKPVVCLKVGRSAAGQRAALAHTGAIVGSDRAFSALLRSRGALRVDDFHEFVETLEVLGRRRRPQGRRIGGISESGGECALLADHAELAGIPFAPLPEDLAADLAAEFPNYGRPQNPLDAWAVDEAERVFPRSLELMAQSGAFDILVAQIDLSAHRGAGENEWCEMIVRALGRITSGTDIFPAVTSVGSSDPPPAIAAAARDLDIALLRGAREATRALAAAAACGPAVARPKTPPRGIDLSDLLPQGGALPEHESSLVLERYGIAVAPHARATDPDSAARAATELGFPVVVKIDGVAHKSAAGGVLAGVATADAAAEGARRLGGPVLVARQLPPGPEYFCGMIRDPDYGPVLAVGWGGLRVEALEPACELAPIDRDGAVALILDAGLPPAATALADVLIALGQIAVEHPGIAEIDVNPLLLTGDGPVAVDALVVVGAPDA